VNIITEVSSLASHMATMPREGHLDALFDMFCYLKMPLLCTYTIGLQRNHNSILVFDLTYPEINWGAFVKHD